MTIILPSLSSFPPFFDIGGGSCQGSRRPITDRNELIRRIAQACAACKHGRNRLICRLNQSQCPNRKVREWLKQIEQIDKNAEVKYELQIR